MFTVYIGVTPISFVDLSYPIPHVDGVFYSTADSSETMLQFIDMVEKSKEIKQVLICHENPEASLREFESHFQVIEAAGGLVLNPEGEVLFIYRLGKWDLPKGKIEKGELVEAAAIREVSEECGVSELTILKSLPVTYHTYSQRSARILKKTYWFEMKVKNKSKLVPQKEEGITEAKWMNTNELKSAMKNTFPSVQDVVSHFFKTPFR
jgi:ADP-ribose pyrophosphatase YjhB (NUDIX family)